MSRPCPASFEPGDSTLPPSWSKTSIAVNLRAPTEDRRCLIAPPLSEAAELIAAGCRVHCQSGYDVQGRTLAELADCGRRVVFAAAQRYTRRYRNVEPIADF